jgi:hypothetical protein
VIFFTVFQYLKVILELSEKKIKIYNYRRLVGSCHRAVVGIRSSAYSYKADNLPIMIKNHYFHVFFSFCDFFHNFSIFKGYLKTLRKKICRRSPTMFHRPDDGPMEHLPLGAILLILWGVLI